MLDQQKLQHLLENVERDLRPLGNVARAEKSKKAKRSSLDFLGIRVPVLRARIARGFDFSTFQADDLFTVLEFLFHKSDIYEVMAVPSYFFEAESALLKPRFGRAVLRWTARVENWCHCDGLGSFIGRIERETAYSFQAERLELSRKSDKWSKRLALVSMIKHAGKNTFYLPLEQALEVVENCLNTKERYVDLAIGWVLREASKDFPRQVSEYLSEHEDQITAEGRRRASLFLRDGKS